ncbi:uncharacterized protein FTOL_10134 [Fusarium torulosum]|uniref:BZIP domain-containing protein n=1 Tax=Fusarium torulosum TaxID=33205 RepID=A0AAE8SM82_9HYPO|nr:uncharacterized protein FTOL_10134 [Fusarium torulosum]
MLDGCVPDVAIGNNLSIYGPAVPSHPQWTILESMNPLAFLGAFQDEVNISTVSRQIHLPQNQFVFYEDFSSRDRWADTYSTVKNQTPSPSRLVTVADESPLTFTPSLQSSQESPKPPGGKSKKQLSRKKANVTNGNGVNGNNGATYHKLKKHVKMQERDRITANKLRLRKKEDLMRLQSVEQAMEQRHKTLSRSVDDLKEEVLYLKMQLLQHKSCKCTLIQHYINEEAQQFFIKSNSSKFLYHVILTLIDFYLDLSGAKRSICILGTRTILKAAKDSAFRVLHTLRYESEDFIEYAVHSSHTGDWAYGNGFLVYAKAPADQVFQISVQATPNTEQLLGDSDGSIILPQGAPSLYYVTQTVIDYNKDRTGYVQEMQIVGTFVHRTDAINAARKLLDPLDFAEYDTPEKMK